MFTSMSFLEENSQQGATQVTTRTLNLVQGWTVFYKSLSVLESDCKESCEFVVPSWSPMNCTQVDDRDANSPAFAGDLRFLASSPALPLWYLNLPLFASTINIVSRVGNSCL